MLETLKRVIRRPERHPAEEWMHEPPKDWLFGDGKDLPYPNVNQPSPGLLAGTELPEFPSYLALEATNICNLKCTHCNYRHGVAHYTRDRGSIDHDTVRKVLKEAAQYKAGVLMNYDGEPLANKNFIDFLEIATELGVNAYFNTNGTLFDKTFADRLVSFFKGSVFFSVDGSKDWFEKVRVGANYDQVVANVKYFLKINEAAGNPITVGISFCNLGQGPEQRRAFVNEWLPQVNYVSLGEVNDKMGTKISESMTEIKLKKRIVCSMPWETVGICHNGDVVPCSIYITRANTAKLPNVTKNGNAIFGNVNEQSIKEIWHSEGYRRFRQLLAEERVNNTFCQNCERWLNQIQFAPVFENDVKIERNGYWTTFHNLKRGELKFRA